MCQPQAAQLILTVFNHNVCTHNFSSSVAKTSSVEHALRITILTTTKITILDEANRFLFYLDGYLLRLLTQLICVNHSLHAGVSPQTNQYMAVNTTCY